jgi:hypothetical protein
MERARTDIIACQIGRQVTAAVDRSWAKTSICPENSRLFRTMPVSDLPRHRLQTDPRNQEPARRPAHQVTSTIFGGDIEGAPKGIRIPVALATGLQGRGPEVAALLVLLHSHQVAARAAVTVSLVPAVGRAMAGRLWRWRTSLLAWVSRARVG